MKKKQKTLVLNKTMEKPEWFQCALFSWIIPKARLITWLLFFVLILVIV